MMLKFRRTAIFLFLIFCDTLSITLSFILAYHIRFYSNLIPITKGIPDWIFYLNTLYFAVPIFLIVFYLNDFYTLYFVPAMDELIRILKSVTFGMIFVTMVVAFYREYEFSRVVFFMIWIFAALFLFFVREFFKISARVVLRRLYGLEKVLVVGKKTIC